MTSTDGADPQDFGGPPVEPLDPMLLAETLAALSDRLAGHEALLAALVDRLDQDEHPGGPWAWRFLTEPQGQALLAELRDWVHWLTTRYELDSTRHQIPACWSEHPVAVEELTGLMVAWKSAYSARSRQTQRRPHRLARPLALALPHPAQRATAGLEHLPGRSAYGPPRSERGGPDLRPAPDGQVSVVQIRPSCASHTRAPLSAFRRTYAMSLTPSMVIVRGGADSSPTVASTMTMSATHRPS